MSYCRGLRYLDLSHNRLSDTTCAEIVRVACASALEYLDLGYNLIQKGSATRDALEKHLNSSRLRHLGLAHNELSKKLLSSLLDTLRSNSTLTSLDLSNNELRHSQKEYLNGSLRLFLRDNSHVRQMDLSFNNFDAKTIQAIQLGLLQNETMLIILLAGNVAGIKSNDFDLVLDKLRLNRKAYRDKASRTSFDLKLSLSSPPTMSDAPSTPLLKQEQMVLDSLFSDEESVPASLTVLFSAPLAWRDRTNKLYPIETLDHASERDALIQGKILCALFTNASSW